MQAQDRKIIFNIYSLLKYLSRGKLLLCICIILSAAGGLALSFKVEKEYTASIKIIDNESSENSGAESIIGLIGLTGSFITKDDAIVPQIFPDYLSSPSFIRSLCAMPITTKNGESMTYKAHLIKQYMPDEEIEDSMYSAQMIALGKIACALDQQTQLITIDVTDQDAFVAACVADSIFQHLQRDLVDYRIGKSEADMRFLNKIAIKAKKDYDEAFERYTKAMDQDMEAEMQSVVAKVEAIENDMNIKYDIYTQIHDQIRLLKMDMGKDKTSLTLVTNSTVPIKPITKSKIFFIAVFSVLGVFLWILIIILWRRKEIISIE